ncbi:MAG: winged helix-turn-helix transcriptional regulator, partial [Candidatus Thorarchaeota archaeon]|nr:winged helix-turn-helix transcriptional regulator [Candidatus Thorarchaeota archaeon]
ELSLNEILRSALLVLDHLSENGPMAPRDIARGSKIPLRTVTFALSKLIKQNLLHKVPHLMDMRKQLYHLDTVRISAIENDIDHLRTIARTHMRAI